MTSDNAPRLPAWAVVLPIVALLATALLWYRTDRELSDIRRTLAALDRSPTVEIAGAATLGPADARVVLIEFSDYECPFCIRHTRETMPKLETGFIRTGRIRYVFRDFPIDQLHPDAIRAHEAARCANEQQKFWEMHRRLFSAPGTHGPAALSALAGELGLNVPDFQSCLASGRTTAGIRESAGVAVDLGANGTPAFYVGLQIPDSGRVKVVQAISGAQPYEVFEKALEEVLKQSR